MVKTLEIDVQSLTKKKRITCAYHQIVIKRSFPSHFKNDENSRY